ncbi:MAG: lipoyl(octanoyl) transferase LipB [Mariprofundales bacterium]
MAITQQNIDIISHRQQEYADSLAEQEKILASMLTKSQANTEPNISLIFTEHPAIFTIGTSGSRSDIKQTYIAGTKIAIHNTGRGGEVTYHGPGQLVCYVLVDLRQQRDLHAHVWRLEEWMIQGLAQLGVQAQRKKRGIGVWVEDKKIAAIGVRCRRWITWHGIALNIKPNMAHFSGIIPCGMADVPVTSLQQMGKISTRKEVEQILTQLAGYLLITKR